jgi:Transposase DDE domain group 1
LCRGRQTFLFNPNGTTITSDAGALLLGAADRSIAMMHRLAACFHDTRRQDLIEHEVVTLVGQRVFGIALGYEDLNDRCARLTRGAAPCNACGITPRPT